MIFSLSGLIGSGKDSIAEHLVHKYDFVQESFAHSLKDAVAIIFGWDRTMLDGRNTEARAWRDVVDQWWANRLGIPHLTPRWVLQNFGTDCCRQHFHDAIWRSSLERRLTRYEGRDVVITDARFNNELIMLHELGATTVMVRRGPLPDWWSVAQRVRQDPTAMLSMTASGIHSSEWDWADFQFDVTMFNDSTLNDLHAAVDDMVNGDGQKSGCIEPEDHDTDERATAI